MNSTYLRIAESGNRVKRGNRVSAPRENVLIVPGRNILLTGSGWRGGGNRSPHHDPAGPTPAGGAEKGKENLITQRRAAGGMDVSERQVRLGDPVEGGRRPGSSAQSARAAIEPATEREDAGKGSANPVARRVPRVLADAGERVWKTSFCRGGISIW